MSDEPNMSIHGVRYLDHLSNLPKKLVYLGPIKTCTTCTTTTERFPWKTNCSTAALRLLSEWECSGSRLGSGRELDKGRQSKSDKKNIWVEIYIYYISSSIHHLNGFVTLLFIGRWWKDDTFVLNCCTFIHDSKVHEIGGRNNQRYDFLLKSYPRQLG